MLKLMMSEDKDELKKVYASISFSQLCSKNWDEPEIDKTIDSDELLEQL